MKNQQVDDALPPVNDSSGSIPTGWKGGRDPISPWSLKAPPESIRL